MGRTESWLQDRRDRTGDRVAGGRSADDLEALDDASIIICAVQATSAIFQGQEWNEIWNWLKILIVFDIIFLILAILTFEYVIEE